MRRVPFLPVMLLAMCAPAAVPAADLTPAKPESVGLSSERLVRLHETVQRRIDAHQLAGAVTVVARRGHIVHFEAQGLADLETKQPMTKETLFRLASSSKPVTAVAVLMLMEEGKLKLTDPVSKYIPEFANPRVMMAAEHAPRPMADRPASGDKTYTAPAERDIEIVDLLTHTSGLASGGIANAQFMKLMLERKPADTLADVVPRFGALPLDFQPGTQWRYSGLAGFDTLGRIVEIVSGLSFDRFLHDRLFAPLGMHNTFFNVPEEAKARLATIYNRTPNGLVKPEHPLVIGSPVYFSGAGGLVSTAGDYLRFAEMLCNGGELDGVRILSPWTVDLMMRNHVGDLFLGQIGRPPKGMGFGLGGEIVLNGAEARMRKPDGSYGWDGAFGTYWWVNRHERMVAILFVQTPGREHQYDLDNAVSQSVIE